MSEATEAQPPEANTSVPEQNSWYLTRWLFIRLMGLIYFMAFGSYAVQVLGLNGSHGVIPIADVLNAVKDQMGDERVLVFPTLYWINSTDQFLQIVTWGGTALSILVILGIASGPAL